MGSLMPGWNALSPRGANNVPRTLSLTKEEIDDFWNKRKQEEEEHRKAAEELAQAQIAKKTATDENTISTDQVDGKESTTETPSLEEELDSLTTTTDWWTKSHWAFLNEPPIEAKGWNLKYNSQFDVASLQPTSSAHD